MPADSGIESGGEAIAEVDLQLAHHRPKFLVVHLDGFIAEAIEQVVTNRAIEDLCLLRNICDQVEP